MKKNNGITLIALIITIIIMLILVAVTISILINSGLIGKAKQAGEDTKTAYEQEERLGEKITIEGVEYNSIDEYTNSINENNSNLMKFYLQRTGQESEPIEIWTTRGCTWLEWAQTGDTTLDTGMDIALNGYTEHEDQEKAIKKGIKTLTSEDSLKFKFDTAPMSYDAHNFVISTINEEIQFDWSILSLGGQSDIMAGDSIIENKVYYYTYYHWVS